MITASMTSSSSCCCCNASRKESFIKKKISKNFVIKRVLKKKYVEKPNNDTHKFCL